METRGRALKKTTCTMSAMILIRTSCSRHTQIRSDNNFTHSAFSLRDVFLKWDKDQDGFIDSTELRKGLSSLNLGVPEGVIGI